MLISAEHLSINFGSRQLLDDVDFYLNEGDKTGVIGINGTGKSTFLKVLAGKLQLLGVPRNRLEDEFHAQAAGDFLRQIDIEADRLILAVGSDKRRIGRAGAKMERLG